jgi:hypothetical protein
MLTTIAYVTSGAVGVAIIGLGARFLLAPRGAAAGFGVPAGEHTPAHGPYPWHYTKGVRDIASGIFLWILLANREAHLLGAFMVAASLIPIGDAAIVLRSGGLRSAAYGIHGATAVVMLAAGITLLLA